MDVGKRTEMRFARAYCCHVNIGHDYHMMRILERVSPIVAIGKSASSNLLPKITFYDVRLLLAFRGANSQPQCDC